MRMCLMPDRLAREYISAIRSCLCPMQLIRKLTTRWLLRHAAIAVTLSAVGLFIALARQSETRCQMNLEILTVLLALNDS